MFKEDLSGYKFGRWTVLEYDSELSAVKRKSYWKCRCECGTIKSIEGYTLKSGISKSCGCLSKEITSERFSKTNQIYSYDSGYSIALFNTTTDFFIFDTEDIDIVESRCWHKQSKGYVVTNKDYNINNEVLLHRAIMSKYYDIIDKEIDHINHNILDNRKCNLRLCTRSENLRNTKITSNTGYKNIHYSPIHNSYMFSIKYQNNHIQKRFKTLEEAIKYRDTFLSLHPDIAIFSYKPETDFRELNNSVTKPFIFINDII